MIPNPPSRARAIAMRASVTVSIAAEMIGGRFPYYHPGVFSGIFSIAITRGLLAPTTLGYFAEIWDIRVVMWLPLAGSVMVLILVLLTAAIGTYLWFASLTAPENTLAGRMAKVMHPPPPVPPARTPIDYLILEGQGEQPAKLRPPPLQRLLRSALEAASRIRRTRERAVAGQQVRTA